MSYLSVLCLFLILLVQGSYSQWRPIFEQTGPSSGNIGAQRTYPNGSQLGGYLHGDLRDPNIVNGGGIRGRYQGDRFHVGGDANVRFPSGRRPSYDVSAYGSRDLGNGWSVGARGSVGGQFGTRPNYGAHFSITKKFGRRRRSIGCIRNCRTICYQGNEECLLYCITHVCGYKEKQNKGGHNEKQTKVEVGDKETDLSWV